jgi:hypothetical protein
LVDLRRWQLRQQHTLGHDQPSLRGLRQQHILDGYQRGQLHGVDDLRRR